MQAAPLTWKPRARRPRPLTVALAAVLAMGCAGDLAGAPDDDSPSEPRPPGSSASGPTGGGGRQTAGPSGAGSTQTGGAPAAPALCGDRVGVGPSAMRHLTRRQYDNTVRALLGEVGAPARDFTPDEQVAGFSVGLTISPSLASSYQRAAEELAQKATADLEKLAGCSPTAAGEEACARRFIESFAPRAFRRALRSAQLSRLEALYRAGRADADFRAGIQLVLQAILQSPFFLHHVEIGQPVPGRPGLYRLTAHEVANRLGYFLWNSMPDADLFRAADTGALATLEGVSAQARRMLQDPRAAQMLAAFHADWLETARLSGADKDARAFPIWTRELQQAMAEETRLYVEEAFLRGSGSFEGLFLGTKTFANAALARVYGVAGPTGREMVPVSLDPKQRAGLVTQAGLLAAYAGDKQTSPVIRGQFVRERLLCADTPEAPPDNNFVPPDPTPGTTTRERFAEHARNPACRGCHEMIDGIGFGLEAYDPVGRYRETDGGKPVDVSGQIVGTRDLDGSFRGAIELAQRISRSRQARECLGDHVFTYALGRAPDAADACARQAIQAAFSGSSHNLRELVLAVARSEAFAYRQVPATEGGTP